MGKSGLDGYDMVILVILSEGREKGPGFTEFQKARL